MLITPGTHTLGPDAGTLLVKTGRKGAAAKAGHDLSIEVTSWSATIEAGADSGQTRLELTAEAGSLRVRNGRGGLQSLGDDDKDTSSASTCPSKSWEIPRISRPLKRTCASVRSAIRQPN